MLSCCADHKEGVEEDNLNQVLLDPKFFRIRATQLGAITTIRDAELRRHIWECPEKDVEVCGALNMILTIGPHLLVKNLQEWNYNNSIVLFWGKVYVLNNLKLQRDIAKMHHNLVAPGHPGRFNMWWPGMLVFVQDYFNGCATSQMSKPSNHPAHVLLVPNKISERPFGTITTNFITDLSECEGHNAIYCVVNQLTKGVVVSPYCKTINTDGTVDILLEGTFQCWPLGQDDLQPRLSVCQQGYAGYLC